MLLGQEDRRSANCSRMSMQAGAASCAARLLGSLRVPTEDKAQVQPNHPGPMSPPCRPVMLQAAEAGQQPQQTGSSGAAQQAGAPHAPLPTLPGAALNPAHYSFAFGLASAGRRSRICSKRQRRCQAIFNRWLSCWRGQSWNSHPVVPGWPWAAAAAPDDQACSERRHHRYRLLAARKASAWPLRSWPDQAAMFP